ncbi:2-oxo-4-hydroxy-4-carboxy-5-ureidoimidazoline decarboxylase [uncultured Roseibium sp.]|uniref:2-oxo-4-hydroxy-4-carboxy-5-ureidoimidazoline decarboxylase n=1 Tax=uncultured Roseibium sp. TaxID=1936171 RepID=UPI00260EAA7F|nr:2-oxo-4-hydroxy-4-carboxy-5-ureidoimidazoline decarboxylase [uncultured Roseibium sp.]
MIAIDRINEMDLEAFLAAFGDVAEHSPWVAEDAFCKAPFADREDVIAAFEAAMNAAPAERKFALVRAHPDLAGKAALAGDIAEDSRREQAGAGLNTLSREEFDRFTQLNTRYKSKFGFPFIFAVKGATKHMILAAFEDRISNSSEEELKTALAQIARIFRFRLEDRIK